MRLPAALLAIGFALTGCGGFASPHPALPTSAPAEPPPRSRPSAVPTTSAPLVRLQDLVLRADLSSRPERLVTVVRIPFGPRADQVGLLTDRRHTSVPVFPPSFAVGPDGSFWLVDLLKHRLAHFDRDGAYVGEITGIPFDRFHPQPQDLAMVGSTLYLLEQDHQHWLLSSLVSYRDGRAVFRSPLAEESRPVIVLTLISGTPTLTGLDGGLAGHPYDVGTGAQGPATLDATSPPNVHLVSGIPVGDRVRLAGAFDPARPDDRYLLTLVGADNASIQPIRFVVTPTGADHARHLPAEVGFHLEAVLPDRMVAWVPLAPSQPGDAERYGGGAWMLQFSVNGSPLVWARLPEPGLSSEAQTRRFAAGPNGTLYFMQAQRDGMVISQVPTS